MIKKVKLNYRAAAEKTPPVKRVIVPGSHMEQLDQDIRSKTKQNRVNYDNQ